ncbi:MAG TPA: FtsX-like permease family protein, partial [Anaerolineae bacterium]
MNGALRRAGWRYLRRHRAATALMVLGVALGVAVMVAIDLANSSASRAFDLSIDAVAGRATHQIVGGPRGLDEAVYTRLRVQGGIERAAPVVSDYLTSPQLGNRPIQLLGIDPLAEGPFRSYLGGAGAATGSAGGAVPAGQLVAFLTRPGALFISDDLAAQSGVRLGQTIDVTVAGRRATAYVAGLLHPGDALTRRGLSGLVLADIATVQELTGRLGRLDQIDLILPANDSAAEAAVTRLLPPDAQLVAASARAGAIDQMTAAFRTNLTALSLLALLVGMFLIYNSMTFAVIQRRPLFGTLRCLGATREEVAGLVLSEAAVIGVLGSALGLGLGVLMGHAAVRLVTQTIGDLYYVVTVTGATIPLASLAKGALLGLLTTLVSAALPAWEAASVPPRLALSRSGVEDRARRAVPLTAAGGGLGLLVGAAILAIPTRSLPISFAGIFFLTIGFALLAPGVTLALLRGAAPAASRAFGVLGRLAPRSVTATLSRTAVAIAALMVAVSVTIGVGLMIDSFRTTVVAWLGQTLYSDIYISAPSLTSTRTATELDPRVVDVAAHWPGVQDVQQLRSANVLSPSGPLVVSAVQARSFIVQRMFVSTEGDRATVTQAVDGGAIIVSEPLANRLNLPAHRATLTLKTDQGPHVFPIAGVYRDYASSQGVVMMAAQTYHTYWQDPGWTSVSLSLAPGVDPDRF